MVSPTYGRVIWYNPVQAPNEFQPMRTTLSGTVTYIKPVQP